MPISFQCPRCGGRIRAPDEAAGKRAKCPKCSAAIEVAVSEQQRSSQADAAQGGDSQPRSSNRRITTAQEEPGTEVAPRPKPPVLPTIAPRVLALSPSKPSATLGYVIAAGVVITLAIIATIAVIPFFREYGERKASAEQTKANLAQAARLFKAGEYAADQSWLNQIHDSVVKSRNADLLAEWERMRANIAAAKTAMAKMEQYVTTIPDAHVDRDVHVDIIAADRATLRTTKTGGIMGAPTKVEGTFKLTYISRCQKAIAALQVKGDVTLIEPSGYGDFPVTGFAGVSHVNEMMWVYIPPWETVEGEITVSFNPSGSSLAANSFELRLQAGKAYAIDDDCDKANAFLKLRNDYYGLQNAAQLPAHLEVCAAAYKRILEEKEKQKKGHP